MSRKSSKKIRKHGLPPGTLVYTGEQPTEDAVVNFFQFDTEKLVEQKFLPEQIRIDSDDLLWIDLRGLSQIKLVETIGQRFNIHPLILEDVVNVEQRPKFEEYENGLFFVIHNPKVQHSDELHCEWQSEQIGIFCGKNFTVSFQEHADDTFRPVVERLRQPTSRLRRLGASYMTYALLDLVVDRYYPTLDDLEILIENLEKEISEQGATNSVKTKIFTLKNTVNQFRRSVKPLREIVQRLLHPGRKFISESSQLYFRDLSDHVIYVVDSIENLQERVDNLHQFYEAQVNLRLNNTMRLLAVISTIFMPLSFITGIFGMNFDRMPMLHDSNGFFVLAGFMLTVALVMLFYFKKRNWI